MLCLKLLRRVSFNSVIDGIGIASMVWRVARLNGLQHALFAMRDKQDCIAGTPCTTCTANTVDVTFRIVRHVEVNNMANTLNVQTTGNHVGSYQDINFTLFQTVNGALPGILGNVTI